MKRFFQSLILTSLVVSTPLLAGDLLNKLTKQNFPKPSVALKKVSISAISLEDIGLRLDTAINNPYPVNLPKTGLDLDMNIEGSRLVKLSNSKVVVDAMKSATVPFDVNLKFKDLAKIFKKAAGKEALGMDLNGKVNVFLPLEKLKAKGLYFKGMPGSFPFPVKASRPLPSVQPFIALRNFKIIQPSSNEVRSMVSSDAVAQQVVDFVGGLLSGKSTGSASKSGLGNVDFPVKTEFQMVLTNNAAAKILFQKLNYELSLGNEKFLSGDTTQIENKGRESIATIRSTFPIKSVSTGIANVIMQRKADYRLAGKSGIQIPQLPGDGDVPFNFDTRGNLKW